MDFTTHESSSSFSVSFSLIFVACLPKCNKNLRDKYGAGPFFHMKKKLSRQFLSPFPWSSTVTMSLALQFLVSKCILFECGISKQGLFSGLVQRKQTKRWKNRVRWKISTKFGRTNYRVFAERFHAGYVRVSFYYWITINISLKSSEKGKLVSVMRLILLVEQVLRVHRLQDSRFEDTLRLEV